MPVKGDIMQKDKRKLRFGMVGGGQGAFIGAIHRIAATLDNQADLVAGCFSRDPGNTRITGEQLLLDPARCYGTYQEMAEKEAELGADEKIDFVIIATQNVSHYDIARIFLQAGFHVVCDKPMTYSLFEADSLVKLVKETGLVFALTYNYTGNSLIRHARQMFRSGSMGTVRKVIIEYLQDCLMLPLEKQDVKQAVWRVDPKQAGLVGIMGDAGTHCENLIEYIIGEPITEVCADFSTFVSGRVLDEDANLLFRLKSGGKGIMTVSQVCVGEENGLRLKIYASEGAIVWEQENPNYMYVYKYGQPRQILGRAHKEYLSEESFTCTRVPAGHPEGYLEAFANIYCKVFDAIRSHILGKPLQIDRFDFPSVIDGWRGMQFITKAAESNSKGSVWININYE